MILKLAFLYLSSRSLAGSMFPFLLQSSIFIPIRDESLVAITAITTDSRMNFKIKLIKLKTRRSILLLFPSHYLVSPTIDINNLEKRDTHTCLMRYVARLRFSTRTIIPFNRKPQRQRELAG